MTSTRTTTQRKSEYRLTDRLGIRPERALVWFGAFVLAIALLGGSSRPDPVQNAILLPLAALLLIPALYNLRLADFGHAKPLGFLLFALVLWMIIQIVPLPPEMWQALPGRETFAEIDRLAALSDIWRPISMTPFRSFGSLMGMIIPITAFLLALALKLPPRTLLFAILAISLVDASFGLLQIIGGQNSPLYQYAFASRGAPAGIFANENHSAVFSAISLLIITRLALEARDAGDLAWVKLSLAPAFLFILLAVLVTGSRAGFMATLAALLAASVMWVFGNRTTVGQAEVPRGVRRIQPNRLAILGFAAAMALVIFAFVWTERTPAAQDIVDLNAFDDLRWSLLPLLREMALDHWGAGTGFGSFYAVYRIYEPTALLIPSYVNHAHNDWMQIAIEGGLPAIAILGIFLAWLVKSVASTAVGPGARIERCVFWAACIVIIAAASLVDYPLRTPVFQASLVWLVLCLADDRVERRSDFGR